MFVCVTPLISEMTGFYRPDKYCVSGFIEKYF